MRSCAPDFGPSSTDESDDGTNSKIAISRGKPTTFSVPNRTGPC